jgi:uncharacterized protein (TIGR03437 family)
MLVRVRNGAASYEPFVQTINGTIAALPIDLGPATDQVYLVLFGSGIGKTGSATTVSTSIGGVNITPIYADPQGTWAGLDQYNILLPRSFIGNGGGDRTQVC